MAKGLLNFSMKDVKSKKEPLIQVNEVSKKDIAIIGLATKLPLADHYHQYWENLRQGVDCVRECPETRRKDIDDYFTKIKKVDQDQLRFAEMAYLDKIDQFDYRFFGLSPKQASLMDPHQRLFLETTWEAIEDAGYGGEKIVGSRTGVYVGFVGDLNYKSLVEEVEPHLMEIASTGNIASIIASRISYLLDLRGPSILVDTACSASLVAVHYACQGIRNGDCEMAIAGGVRVHLTPMAQGGADIGIKSSNNRARTFDDRSDGTGIGEGVVSLLLKPLHKAVKDQDHIYGVIKGTAINQDGSSIGITAPNPEAQEDVIIRAWKDASIGPETIRYIECHGTGTELGDPIEIDGISRAFRKYTNKKQFCAVGSVKTNIGHLDNAAGIAGLVKALLALKNKEIPPLLHFERPNRKIPFENSPVYVNTRLQPWEDEGFPRRCGISAFGLSGTNCHVILEEAPETTSVASGQNEAQLLALSAKSKQGVQRLVQNYHQTISSRSDLNLKDICYTANTGRGHYEYRLIMLVEDIADLKTKLKMLIDAELDTMDQSEIYYGHLTNTPRDQSSLTQITKQKVQELSKTWDQDGLAELGQFYIQGAEIDWIALYQKHPGRKVSLPVYPFEPSRCWLDIPDNLPAREGLNLNGLLDTDQLPEHLATEIKEILARWQNESSPVGEATSARKITIQIQGREDGQYSDLEMQVAQIWGDVLGYNEINIYDDFYQMGGDSIMALTIVNHLNQELHLKLEIPDLLQRGTLDEFWAYLQETHGDNQHDQILPVEEREYYLVSAAQRRMYFINQINGGDTSYNIPSVLSIEGKLDQTRFIDTFKRLVQRHEAFRTSFSVVDQEIVQQIHLEVDFDIDIIEATDQIGTKELVTDFIRPFDLSQAPLLRVGLIKESATRSILMIDMHHIISDGTSIGNLVSEFINLYAGMDLPELKIQYKDFVAWQNQFFASEEMTKQEEYWLHQFADEIPVLNLPTDYSRSAKKSFTGDRYKVSLQSELTSQVKKLTSQTGSTLYMVLMTAFNILLARYANQEDIVVGSPIAGRKHADLEKLIGMFVNTLAMRNYPKSSMRFKELLAEVKANALQAYAHQEYQFETLVEKLNLERDHGRNPLFDVMFVLQNTENTQLHSLQLEDLVIKPYEFDLKVAKFDLTLMAVEKEDGLIFSFEYRTDLFKDETIRRLAAHYINILKEVVADPEVPIAQIQMISPAEREQIVQSFNNVQVDYSKEKTIGQLFEEQVQRTPDQLALVFADEQLTYQQLNERANQLARTLRNKGVGLDQAVGIMVDKSLEMIIGVLAIVKAGGVYLPIDIDYPESRIQYMLEDSRAQILLSQDTLIQEIFGKELPFKGEVLNIYNPANYEQDVSNLDSINGANDLIYIIYTSGSTGKPKGVMIEHQNVNRLISNSNMLQIDEDDRILQTGSIAFDASTFEIWGALLNGACLYLIQKNDLLSATNFEDKLKSQQITMIWLTAPLFNQLLDENPAIFAELQTLFVGGDALSPKHVNKVRQANPKLQVVNGYGPTENTTFTTFFRIKKDYQTNIPIGQPVSNTLVYILTQNNQVQPIGVPGELCIGGDGLARGYLNRPDFTQEKFVPHPFDPSKRIYRTGDLVRWLPDGNIEFLGRIDHQVKIRGFRIELGEIESHLLDHPAIENGLVLVKVDEQQNKFLVAYYTASDKITTAELRSYLMKRLPNYMVPAQLISLAEMPMTTNGKIDRKRLPEPDQQPMCEREVVAPRNQLEEILVQIWSKVLGVEEISVADNFFELGGHSIMVMNVVTQAISYGLNLTVQNIFDYPTIQQLAEKLNEGVEEQPPIEVEDLEIAVRNYEESRRQIASTHERPRLKKIFLTGVTGFLGAHILETLLINTEATIYCLIRANDQSAATARLTQVMERYFTDKYNHWIGDRIVVVMGDLAQDQFGLSDLDYATLGRRVDTILHAAALVKHFGDYEIFKQVNVLGTQQVIDFALQFNTELHYISTMSVAGSIAKGEKDIIFTEKDFYVGQNYADNVYVRSKFEAENLIFQAIKQGLLATVYRVGNLTARYVDGHFQQNIGENAFYNYLKSIIELEQISEEMSARKFEFTPIDYCSQAIVGLMQWGETLGEVYHIYNHQRIKTANLLPVLEKEGIQIKILPQQEFMAYVNALTQDQEKVDKLQGLLHSHQFSAKETGEYQSRVVIDSTLTIDELSQIDFHWPEVDTDYLEKLVAYMKKVRFIA